MIKQIIKKIITALLKWEAILVLRKYKPKIIAITGTVGKTSAKDAIASVLSGEFYVRKSEKSYNSEFGVPLTILGAKSAWSNPFKWFLVLFKGIRLLIAHHDYPELLVLEMGVARPNDMEKLISWASPDVGVITAIGDVPVHIEYFKEPEDLAKEKLKLVKKLGIEKRAVLNGDDKLIIGDIEKIKAGDITFGFSEEVDLRASDYRIVSKEEGEREIPEGITFKVNYKGSIVPIRLFNAFGVHYVYTALSALCVGVTQGLNLIEMAESLSRHKPPPGRLRLLDGIKNSFILDDSYNSSPVAVEAAFNVLDDFSGRTAKRKIAVLGDMLELGKYTIDEHKKVGKRVKDSVDMLFTVGPRSNFTADEAELSGFDNSKIFRFSTSEEAGKALQDEIKEGDLILVKGSQSMRMEKIVEEIMAHPERKENLLVRQEPEWKKK